MNVLRQSAEIPDTHVHAAGTITITPTRVYIPHISRYGNGPKWRDLSANMSAADKALIPCYIVLSDDKP
jgi:hypothetical protein